MTLKTILLAGTALGMAAMLAAPANAATATSNEIEALKAQMMEMQQRLQDMEVQYSNKLNTIQKTQDEAVVVGLKDGRPTFATADGRFTFGITGRAHLDTGFYEQNTASRVAVGNMEGNANFRRVRLGFGGTVMKDGLYNIELNMGDSGLEKDAAIYEAVVHYKGFDGVLLTLGATKPKMTMDDSTSSNDITFIERSTAANLATSFAAGEARMTAGGQYNNENFFAAAYYTMGAAGAATGADFDTSNVVGRVAYAFAPTKGANLHFGASGAHAFNLPTGTIRLRDRPELRVDARRLIDANFGANAAESATTYGPELAFSYGPFRAQGEYYRYQVNRTVGADADFDAWYLQASYVLTGEAYKYDIKKAAYSGVKPSAPLMTGGIGAWEIAARYSQADLNDIGSGVIGGEQDIITLGLNWYPGNNVRFMMNYLNVKVDDYGAVLGRDVSHDAFALRTQFSF